MTGACQKQCTPLRLQLHNTTPSAQSAFVLKYDCGLETFMALNADPEHRSTEPLLTHNNTGTRIIVGCPILIISLASISRDRILRYKCL